MASVPRSVKLLDAVTADDEYGPWVPIANARPNSIMIHVVGITGGTEVQIYLSSQDTPTAAEQVKFGSDITSDGQTEMTTPAYWMRAKLSVGNGAAVTVYASYVEDI